MQEPTISTKTDCGKPEFLQELGCEREYSDHPGIFIEDIRKVPLHLGSALAD